MLQRDTVGVRVELDVGALGREGMDLVRSEHLQDPSGAKRTVIDAVFAAILLNRFVLLTRGDAVVEHPGLGRERDAGPVLHVRGKTVGTGISRFA